MSDEAATIEVSPELKDLGDKISGLTLKQAKELSDYLDNEYGIKPAAGGPVMMAGGGGGGGGEEAVAEQTEFDVVMTGFGDAKLQVVKVVKNMMGNTLMEAKKIVEAPPATIKEKVEQRRSRET